MAPVPKGTGASLYLVSRPLKVAFEVVMPEEKKCKQSLYFPEPMLEEIKTEAARLDRSLSWVVQRAWMAARGQFRDLPTVDQPKPIEPDRAE